MFDPAYRDKLLAMAIDREPMDDGELHDFAALMIEDFPFAEQYILMRRVIADAAELPRAEPASAFVDHVMQRIEQLPAPEPAPAMTRRTGLIATAGISIVLAVIAVWLPGLNFVNWIEWFSSIGWAGSVADAASWIGSVQAGFRDVGQSFIFTRTLIWLAVIFPLLAVIVNIWSIRVADRQIDRR